MHEYALQLQLSDTFPYKPAIHLYFHKCGHPLEINDNGNHFAYLEPISVTIYANIISQESNMIDLEKLPLTTLIQSDPVYDDLQHIHTPQIISQESDIIELEQSLSTTSFQSHPQTQSTLPSQPTIPITPV